VLFVFVCFLFFFGACVLVDASRRRGLRRGEEVFVVVGAGVVRVVVVLVVAVAVVVVVVVRGSFGALRSLRGLEKLLTEAISVFFLISYALGFCF